MKAPVLRSLSSRLFALGLVQLLLLSVLAVLIGLATLPARPGRPPHPPDRAQPGFRPAPPHERPVWGYRSLEEFRRHARTRLGTPLPEPWVGPLLTLLAGVALIGVGAYLTGRFLVAPLRELSRAARNLADGDLGARSGLDRADEIGDVARAFDEMGERIEALVKAERQLLADVSHELRTPLARIHVATDLAAEGAEAEARAALADIAIDLAELEAIVDDILMATRFGSSGPAALHPSALEPVAAAALAEWAAQRFRRRHAHRPLELEILANTATVLADSKLLRRALDNLLDNAHKYTADAHLPVRLRVGMQDGRSLFEVIDRGRGIAAADLCKVWKPFFRTDWSRTRREGGVGLGLTIAKRIVEAHQGSVQIESELGKGTCVRVSLPAVE